ncbi:hypothetical protein GGR52DRAFT_592955 [Hypoxylon sp. FL1284]|nr:hypothetical protein GGR52DRAFT_592955 [Hypoxylon sp. FL1284]
MGNSHSSGGITTKMPRTVIPLFRFDDTPVTRKVIVEFTMRFDDVLDPDKLRLSLEKLLSRPQWRKLGARLRLNEDNRLEYHIPESFDEKRPAIGYSHIQHDTSIAQDPTGSQLPQPTAKPTVLSDPEDYAPLIRRRYGAPRRLDDYLRTDAPQLSLHVASFADATTVALSWPHTLLDAMGRRELLDAWVATLEGRDADVRPLHGVLYDPLAALGTGPLAEPYVLGPRRLSAWDALLFALAYAWTTLVLWRGEETRVMCVPAAHARALRQDALDYLAGEQDKEEGADCDFADEEKKNKQMNDTKPRPFVSEGDVLSAWITRLALLHLADRRCVPKTVSIMNALGLRPVLAPDLLPPGRAYVGNAVGAVYALVPAADVLGARPRLARAAAAVRRSVAEQGTRAQVEARAAADSGIPNLYGDRDMAPVVVSNWTRARFFDTDFGAARASGSREGACRPSYVQPSGHVDSAASRNSFIVVGKDAAGNYWLSGTLGRGLWPRVQRAMDDEHGYLARRLESEEVLGFEK